MARKYSREFKIQLDKSKASEKDKQIKILERELQAAGHKRSLKSVKKSIKKGS